MEDKVTTTVAESAGQSASTGKPDATTPKFRKIEEIVSVEGGDAIFHNFDGGKMDQYRLTALATGGVCKPYEEMPPEGIDLRYWFCHRVEMVAKTGEIITPIRTALIDKSGDAYSFVSDGVARELDALRQIFGDGPYTDPMVIKVSKIKTRSGGYTYVMGPA